MNIHFRTSSSWESTGRTRPRATLLGRVVLQVEEERRLGYVNDGPRPVWDGIERRWRDARRRDLRVQVAIIGQDAPA